MIGLYAWDYPREQLWPNSILVLTVVEREVPVSRARTSCGCASSCWGWSRSRSLRPGVSSTKCYVYFSKKLDRFTKTITFLHLNNGLAFWHNKLLLQLTPSDWGWSWWGDAGSGSSRPGAWRPWSSGHTTGNKRLLLWLCTIRLPQLLQLHTVSFTDLGKLNLVMVWT